MCEKCVEINNRLERYRRLLLSVDNQDTVEYFEKAIASLEAQKAALHPEQEQ